MVSVALDQLYPARCALCGEFDPRPICPICRSEMSPLEPNLGAGPAPVDATAAVHEYHGRAAQAVRRLKYERVMTHVALMAEELRALARQTGMLSADFIVPVPIHWSRRCERGFNQSEALAESFDHVNLLLLKRIRRTRQQVGLTPEQRLANLQGAFRASTEVAGKAVLLIDDVTTSGGTARECAIALKAVGAVRVDLITYCTGGSASDL